MRIEHRANVSIGVRSRLLRGATIIGNGGPVSLGDDSYVARWSIVQAAGGSVRIGHRTGIGDFANLYGQGGLTVGDDVIMASGVRIMTAEHVFRRRDVPIRDQGEQVSPTVIEDGVWLAANVVVLAGVRVGRGAVCAAGAVVTRDVAPFTIVGGVPARLIRERP